MQDFRARSARNGAEGTILEKISDFFRKITEVWFRNPCQGAIAPANVAKLFQILSNLMQFHTV